MRPPTSIRNRGIACNPRPGGSATRLAAHRIMSIGLGLMFCGGFSGCKPDATADFDYENACADVARHGLLVGESVELVESGIEADRVLDILSCIATHPNARLGAAKLAIRALMYIADDDSRSRSLLIEIVKAETTGISLVRDACRVLVYIADAETRRELLEFTKREWPSHKTSFVMDTLKDLGDDDLVTWIEEVKKELPADHVHRALLDRYGAYVRIQKSVPQMLAYIESDEKELDRDWLVRQAMRHGATREQLRNSAVAFLQRMRNVPSSYARSSLVHECEKYDIFSSEDVSQYKAIQEYRESYPREREKRMYWVRVPEIKRAEFYRQKQ